MDVSRNEESHVSVTTSLFMALIWQHFWKDFTNSILISILIFYFCHRKHRPSYETIALTPRKYWSGGGTGHTSGSGWLGDPETNIPALLFPKHVLGLHASDDLAFHRDFEVVHSSSRRLTMNNGSTTLNNGTYPPDILNGGRG